MHTKAVVSKFMKEILIDFDDFSSTAKNHGMREDFQLFDKITNYFPPEEDGKGP